VSHVSVFGSAVVVVVTTSVCCFERHTTALQIGEVKLLAQSVFLYHMFAHQ
jgi:hypothetical protein